MNEILTAKLKLSDYLVANEIPCMPDYQNKRFVEKLSILTGIKQDLKIGAYQTKRVLISLSHVLDEFKVITGNDLLSCIFPCKSKSQKKKRKKSKFTNTHIDRRWVEVRYKALKLGNGSCCLCGATAKDGIKLHVDHIKPKSLYPYLEYELSNLQVLCEHCNIGKSNKDDTDWR